MAVKISGSEPDDIIPSDWTAELDAERLLVWFDVSYYMEAPATDWQKEAVLDTAAGALKASLPDLISNYIDCCMEYDDGVGLLPLADCFAHFEKKLRERHCELADEIIKRKQSNEDDFIEIFIARTGESKAVAIKYLETNYWSLSTALTFYQTDKNEGKI
ncbi:hypothetical protein [Enterobacter cloacae]|uniref:hypothetical protein n=1 Tax=Enterobacter cloacae TaxID=550 RepID=UPI00294DA91F|nr:hypothetical protein [Enterobacter sichuanensis]